MRWSALLGLALVFCAGAPACAGDEPVVGGKTVGEWIAIVQDRGRPTNERDRAIDALRHFGPGAASAVPCLIRVVDEPRTGDTKVDKANDQLRRAAIEVLGRIGPAAAEAVPKLFPRAGDGRLADGRATGLDWAMSLALGRIGRPAVPALIRALQGKDPDLRRFAVETLGVMQDEAAEAVPALIAALDDPALEPHVAHALGRIGPAAAPAVPALAVKLRQSDYGSGDILDALPRIGAAAVPVMVEVFRKEAGDFLRPSEDIAPDVEGFLRLGPDACEAAPALRPYLTDRRPAIRAAAAVALGAIEPETPGVVPALIEVLEYPRHDPKDPRAVTPEQDARSTYGQDAALVLGWIGPPARAALPALLECLKEQEQFEDSDWNDESSHFPGLIGVMIRIDPTGKLVVPALIRAIRRGDRYAMLEATMLEPIPPVVIKALAVAANDDREGVADWARDALARIGPGAAPAVPALIRGLGEKGWSDAAEALGAIGPAAKAAVPALERHVKAGDYRCARAAIALHQIDPTNRAANEYLALMADSPRSWSWTRATLVGALGRWSLEAEFFTREALFTGSNRNCVSGYDWYSSGMCDPDALRRLGRFGPGARAAVPELKRLLTYRDRFVRRWAADALRRIEAKPAR